MDDCTYVFKETERERKRTGYGARYRKCGAKSKKCSLSSDRLTAKELKEKNSQVKTYNLDNTLTYEEFKIMPHDIQKEFLHKCADLGATQGEVADLLGTGKSTLSMFILKHFPNNHIFIGGCKKAGASKWLEFAGGSETLRTEEAPEISSDESCDSEAKEPTEDNCCSDSGFSAVKQASQKSSSADTGYIKYFGKPAMVLDRAYAVLDADDEYMIEISFTKTKSL